MCFPWESYSTLILKHFLLNLSFCIQLVRWRHGLVEVVRLVQYEDRSGSSLVAIKLGKEGEDIYDCMLFQCEHRVSIKCVQSSSDFIK